MKRQLVAFLMIATMAVAIFGSAVAMATPADACIPRVKTYTSFNFYDAYVIYQTGDVGFKQKADPTKNTLETSAAVGELTAREGTNIAYLGVNWKLSPQEWSQLKNKKVMVTAKVRYTLIGGGKGDYGTSSSTVLLGAGENPLKPFMTRTIAYATAGVSKPYQVTSGLVTAKTGWTTLNNLRTTDGTGFIWVALQTHIVSGIAGETTASGFVYVESIQFNWT